VLLQRLAEAGADLEQAGRVTPTGFAPRAVRWLAVIDPRGQWRGAPRPLDPEAAGWVMPVVKRTSKIEACLLCDTAEYALGVRRDDKSSQRHQAFLDLLSACAAQTGSAAVAAVEAALRPERLEALLAGMPLSVPDSRSRIQPQEVVAFEVDGRFPSDEPAVRAFWSQRVAGGLVDPDAAPYGYHCHICGAPCAPLRLWPGPPVGGLGGARRSAALVSFNDPASLSRGAPQALNAPTCLQCAERAQQALRCFVDDDPSGYQHHIEGHLTFLFWSRQPATTEVVRSLFDPDPDQVAQLLASVRSGGPAATLDSPLLHLAVLEGRMARIDLRQWHEEPVRRLQESVAGWWRDQEVASLRGGPVRRLGIRALVRTFCRDERELRQVLERVPAWAEALMASALFNWPLPARLLATVLHRLRRNRRVTDEAMVLVKLCLLRCDLGLSPERKGAVTVGLDRDNRDVPYRLGRLLAVLDEIDRRQRLGREGRSEAGGEPRRVPVVSDRCYGAASTTPRTVFPRLLEQVHPRVARLGREGGGRVAQALERLLDEVMDGLPVQDLPGFLGLAEQGLFALGFHHQRADWRETARAASRTAD
jgi:CRISPR-associated protein Csd1